MGRPRTRWADCIEDLGWNRLGLQPSEIIEVVANRDVWRLNLELLPPATLTDISGRWKKKKTEDINDKPAALTASYTIMFW